MLSKKFSKANSNLLINSAFSVSLSLYISMRFCAPVNLNAATVCNIHSLLTSLKLVRKTSHWRACRQNTHTHMHIHDLIVNDIIPPKLSHSKLPKIVAIILQFSTIFKYMYIQSYMSHMSVNVWMLIFIYYCISRQFKKG